MNERTLFLQALEKTDAAERAVFLAEACGGDEALRQRVETLLRSHTEAGSFLDTPALAQEPCHEATPGDATQAQSNSASAAAQDIALDFLAPSQQAGSLGRLDHYEVMETVGRGGMGIVLRALDEKLHRVVALKVMLRELAGSAAARKRFSREAKAAAAVVHDHIVPIHAIEDAGPTPYLVMQFVEGKSLQQVIDEEGSLELKEILRIGMQIASGLAAAHKQGLVHRDIKPANILLENGVQRVKITDFGLARTVDDASVSQSGVIAGTPQYMSPEQADGKPVDHRSDLFSLGSVMYAMCTGRPPFRAESTVATLKRVCDDTPRPVRELNPDMPEWLCDIIAKLHTKRPEERFQSAKEVADLLEQHLAHLQHPSKMPLPPAIGQQSPRRDEQTRLSRRFDVITRGLFFLSIACLLLITGSWLVPALLSLAKTTVKLECDDPSVQVILRGLDDSDLIAVLYQGNEVTLPPGKYLVRPAGDGHQVESVVAHARGPLSLKERTLERTEDGYALELSRGQQVTLSIILSSAPRERPDNQGWVQLFNGRDLHDWHTHPAQPGDWKVEDGILIGQGGRSHLLHAYAHYENFHLRVELKIVQPGDSGVFFRTNPEFSGTGFPAGYEAQIYGTKVGGIMQRSDCTKDVERGRWFTLEVIARGQQLTLKVNGETTSQLSDEKYSKGCIALQVWDQKTVVHFRKIEIKELPPGSPTKALDELRQLVTLQERELKRARQLYEAARVPAADVAAAEIDLLEARMRLAEVEQKPTEIVPLLRELVKKRGELWDLAKRREAAGVAPPTEVDAAEKALIEARLRLTKATASAPSPLDGRWVFVSAEYQGKQLPPEEAKATYPPEMLFKGDQYGIDWAGKKHEGVLRVDATKTPAEMDFSGSIFAGGKPSKVIYELDGNRLKLCLPFAGRNDDPARPTDFKTGPHSRNVVLIYRREAPPADKKD